MSDGERGDWSGGYWRRDRRGRRIFYVRRMVEGRRYDVSTRATTERGALEQLRRFEADPVNYKPGGDPGREPVRFDVDLVAKFLEFSRDSRKNSAPYIREQKRLLAMWADAGLAGVDLRRATLRDHILPAAEKFKQGRTRELAKSILKAFYSWLRTEKHLILAAEDPTYGSLRVEQGRPAQIDRSKVIPREHFLLAREHLVGAHRDALDILASTGWHVTAVLRFARAGRIEPYPRHGSAKNVVGVIVTPMDKDGEPHRTPITNEEVLAAAERLRERGSLDRGDFFAALRAACLAASIPAFTPGRFRHSVATWAIDAGADPASVAAFLGHRSARTTTRFYATHATPRPVPTLMDAPAKRKRSR